jgi:glucosamine-phosphate N-acetyltransferase
MDSTSSSLFSADLLSSENDSVLVARPLSIGDFDKGGTISSNVLGFCNILGQLTEVGKVSKEQFESRFQDWKNAKDVYFVVVIEDTTKSKIIGSATLFVEKKIVHSAGKVIFQFCF